MKTIKNRIIKSSLKLARLPIVLSCVCLSLLNLSFANGAQSISAYVIWQQKPISINLPLNRSRTLTFLNTVTVGLPASLSQQLTIQNNAGVLKLTALKPFQDKRIEVKDNAAGHQILLNLSAGVGQSDVPLAILYSKPKTGVQSNSGWLKKPVALQGKMAFVTLTRFAEQQLYAPKRLLKNSYNIQLVNNYINARGVVPQHNWFHSLFLDGSTVNIPWAEWFGANDYVTAVLVRNQLPVSINLTNNLTNLCGRQSGLWQAVTFFPSWHLAPAGSLHDTTVAFLISSVPFDAAVKQCEEA